MICWLPSWSITIGDGQELATSRGVDQTVSPVAASSAISLES